MWKRRLLILAVLSSLAACTEEIQQGLDERQANEVQTVLLEQGIDARKKVTPGKKPTWSIVVPESQASDAIRILNKEQLPRPKPPELAESSSLVPTPAEERNRLMARLAVEISQTLETVDGVVSARVHVVVPPAPRLGQPPGPSKASVFLRVRQESFQQIQKMKVELQSLVAGGVENLNPQDVSLVISEVTHAPRRQADEESSLRVWFASLGAIFLLGAGGLLAWAFRQRKQGVTASASSEAGQTNPQSLKSVA